MKWFTPERILIYFALTTAILGGIMTFNTKYNNLIHADEVITKDVCQITTRVNELEARDKKIDKIYDYVIKHKE